MSLKSDIFGMLDDSEKLCSGCGDADELRTAIAEMRRRLCRPLRVAVVGIMKAGKSTFLNALMGADVVFTGNVETTYTVCWFRYGKQASLTVCFRDGSELNTAFEDLERWSVRGYEKENPRINDVKYLVIYYPAEVLKTLEFIDTPGLNSMYGTDAQNTLDFLSIKGSEDTLAEAGMADAVIYAFSRSASGFDQKILEAFHSGGSSGSSPINSIGILTKVDATGIWQIDSSDTPVEIARTVSSKVMENTGMRRLMFTVMPVCARTCEGYAQLGERDWKALKSLARADLAELQDLLLDAGDFKNSGEEDFSQYCGQPDRARLMDCLGQYGILETVRQLKEGLTPEEIGPRLQELCGIRDVRQLLSQHFGNRTFLIKSQYIFNYLNRLLHSLSHRKQCSDTLKNICAQMTDKIAAICNSVQTIHELKALQMYYNGELDYLQPEEQQDLLHVTGEYGREPETRLNVPSAMTVSELAGIARQKALDWQSKQVFTLFNPSSYSEVCAILVRSYEHMYYHLNALIEE